MSDTAPNDTAPNDTAPNDTAPNDTAPNGHALEDRASEGQRRATLAAIGELAGWVADLRWDDVPAPVRDRLQLVLLDSLGVTLVGGRLPERAALLTAWAPAAGPCPVIGTGGMNSTGAHTSGINSTVETAAWLNATAMVSLELDDGNKYAAGHPAAHCFPAVLALAAALDSDGPTTAAALLAGYEVAARFGRASTGRPGLHPHGNWGITGAAAGCARLLGLHADVTAAAIDTVSGMPIAGAFSAAIDGNPVRNEWMGAGNVAGVAAARLAAAGLAHATGIAADSLGDLLGSFDAASLTADLGDRWDVELGYFKRHASCAFTHPTADAAIALRDRLPLGAGSTDITAGTTGAASTASTAITAVAVQTYSAAAALNRHRWDNRLAAMFSIPYVAATALLRGEVAPPGDQHLNDPEILSLAERVTVEATDEFDARLPAARGARVRVTLSDGRIAEHQVDNPIGDADHQPFDQPDTLVLLSRLLNDQPALDRIRRCAADLPTVDHVGPLLRTLTS